MKIRKILTNSIVILVTYLIGFLDINLGLVSSKIPLAELIYYSIFLLKIGAVYTVSGGLENSDKKRKSEFVPPFIYFMLAIQLIHFGSGIVEQTSYNILVLISIPWFFYYRSKDKDLEQDEQ